jgi:hypothetical protein
MLRYICWMRKTLVQNLHIGVVRNPGVLDINIDARISFLQCVIRTTESYKSRMTQITIVFSIPVISRKTSLMCSLNATSVQEFRLLWFLWKQMLREIKWIGLDWIGNTYLQVIWGTRLDQKCLKKQRKDFKVLILLKYLFCPARIYGNTRITICFYNEN